MSQRNEKGNEIRQPPWSSSAQEMHGVSAINFTSWSPVLKPSWAVLERFDNLEASWALLSRIGNNFGPFGALLETILGHLEAIL